MYDENITSHVATINALIRTLVACWQAFESEHTYIHEQTVAAQHKSNNRASHVGKQSPIRRQNSSSDTTTSRTLQQRYSTMATGMRARLRVRLRAKVKTCKSMSESSCLRSCTVSSDAQQSADWYSASEHDTRRLVAERTLSASECLRIRSFLYCIGVPGFFWQQKGNVNTLKSIWHQSSIARWHQSSIAWWHHKKSYVHSTQKDDSPTKNDAFIFV